MNDSTPGASAEIQENPEESRAESFPLVPVADPESAVEERALAIAERNQQQTVCGSGSPFSNSVPQLDSVTPFVRAPMRVIRNEGDTEHLLNGLIAECHLLMRSVVLPTAMRAIDADTRSRFLGTATSLAQTGAKIGRAVAKLRGAGAVNEIRQRHVTEHVLTTPAPQTEKELRT
jgi:hypothetical protein